MKRILTFILVSLLSSECFATYRPTKGSYGAIANNMIGPVDAIIYMLQVSCILCGVGMLIGSLFKFGAWRRNPVEVTLGVPIVMILTSLGLIILGYIHYVTYS